MLVRRASASARASLGPMFLIAKLTRKVIRDFKEGILVWECASTRLKRHDSLIWHNNISCSAFSPSQHSSIHILSLSISIWIPSLSSAMTDSLWFTPHALFSFSWFFCLWWKRSCLYLFSLNPHLDSHFFFSSPLFPTQSFFTTHPLSSFHLPLLSPTHSSSSKEGSLAAKSRHASSRFNFIFAMQISMSWNKIAR